MTSGPDEWVGVLVEPAQQGPAADVTAPAAPVPRRRRLLGALGPWAELVVVIAVAFALAIGLQAFLFKPYLIPSGSMETTLVSGDRVIVVRFWYRFNEVARGDIVVFHPPGKGDEKIDRAPGPANDLTYIKRVIGLPGEWIGGAQQKVWICRSVPHDERHPGSGCRALNEPYVSSLQESFPFRQVAADHYFMMGDNRDNSEDSRFIGQIPAGWMLGRAFVRYWPITRVGWVG